MAKCLCGCGQEVSAKNKVRTNKYILGHNSRGATNPAYKPERHEKRLCTCGCGQFVKDYRKYIGTHNTIGKNNPFYGKHHTEETKIKNSIAHTLENHPQWQGGISFEPYGLDFNKKLKNTIKKRDGRCMICNLSIENMILLKKKMDIHHIDYNKRNNFPQNLILLCHDDHMKTNQSRDEWKIFFQSLLKKEYGYEYTMDQKIVMDFNKIGGE